MAVQFGKSGCSSITVEPFTPICSFDPPAGTTPLTFDVPAVSIAMPVPPAECVCFDFEGSETTGSVATAACGEDGRSTFKTEIVKVDDDCCTGRYTVRTSGTVVVPCMPFDVEESKVTVRNRSGSADPEEIDGGVTRFWVEKGDGSSCCSLTSGIEITLPDCVKFYKKLASGQVRYYDGGELKAADLLDMEVDAEHCSVYPVVTPIEIPKCPLADESRPFTVKVNGREFAGAVTRTDCAYDVEMPDIAVDSPCFSSATIEYKYKYKKGGTTAESTAETAGTGTFTAGADGCYSLKMQDMEFDLSQVGGMSLGGGGSVFGTDNDAGTTDLHVDGALADTPRNQLGGLGTANPIGAQSLAENPSYWNLLGPIKGAQSGDGGPYVEWGQIPQETGHAHYLAKLDSLSNGWMQYSAWRSEREYDYSAEESATASALDYDNGTATGDLSAIVMTGAEWNARGIELRTTNFIYNKSGILSEVYENSGIKDASGATSTGAIGPIVAPGLAVATYSTETRNASGLVVHPEKQKLDISYGTESGKKSVSNLQAGLAVNAGKGLRIHGITGMAEDATSSGAKYNFAQDQLGKLEILKRDDDFTFTSTGRLGFNDKKTSSQTKGMRVTTKENVQVNEFTAFHRGDGNEYVLPVIAASQSFVANMAQNAEKSGLTQWLKAYDSTAASGTGGSMYLDDMREALAVVYLHISPSGVVLGITKDSAQLDASTGRPTTKPEKK